MKRPAGQATCLLAPPEKAHIPRFGGTGGCALKELSQKGIRSEKKLNKDLA